MIIRVIFSLAPDKFRGPFSNEKENVQLSAGRGNLLAGFAIVRMSIRRLPVIKRFHMREVEISNPGFTGSTRPSGKTERHLGKLMNREESKKKRERDRTQLSQRNKTD